MIIYRKIGLGIMGLGVIMFCVGASVFTYRGNINPIASKIGLCSFLFWLPTIILGTIIVAVSKRKRKIIDQVHKDNA